MGEIEIGRALEIVVERNREEKAIEKEKRVIESYKAIKIRDIYSIDR